MTENRRTDSARDHDDSELLEHASDAPAQGNASGGRIARDVGSQDELKRAGGEAAGITRVSKSDKQQPSDTGTRADHKGAGGRDLADRT